VQYIKLLLAFLSLLTQFLKWVNKEHSGDTIDVKKQKLNTFKAALEKAEKGDSDDLEKLFKIDS